nr:MAG TPA: hypothetical protein [Caudoviricetes sp.]
MPFGLWVHTRRIRNVDRLARIFRSLLQPALASCRTLRGLLAVSRFSFLPSF